MNLTEIILETKIYNDQKKVNSITNYKNIGEKHEKNIYNINTYRNNII